MVAPVLSEGAVPLIGGGGYSAADHRTTAAATSPTSAAFHHHQRQLHPPATPVHNHHSNNSNSSQQQPPSAGEPDSPDSLISPPTSPEDDNRGGRAEERSAVAAAAAAATVPVAPALPAAPLKSLIGAYSNNRSPVIVTTATNAAASSPSNAASTSTSSGSSGSSSGSSGSSGSTNTSSSSSSNGSPLGHKPRGLNNNGNTCFFNACMQCLSQTPYLGSIFKDEVVHIPGGEFTVNTAATAQTAATTSPTSTSSTDVTSSSAATNATNSTVTKRLPKVRIEYSVAVDALLQSFKNLMEDMQKSGGVINPHQFFRKFSDLHSQFSGGDQHDSHELLRHLLDSVLIAERRIYRAQLMQQLFDHKLFSKLSATERETLELYATQAKERFLIRRLFQGNLESTLRCETCGHTSPNMETFLDISLPVVSVPAAAASGQPAGSLLRSPSRRQSPTNCPPTNANSSPPPPPPSLSDSTSTLAAAAEAPSTVTIKDNRYAKSHSPRAAAAAEQQQQQPPLTKRQAKRMAKETGRKASSLAARKVAEADANAEREAATATAVGESVAAAEVEKGERERDSTEKADEQPAESEPATGSDETDIVQPAANNVFGNFYLSQPAAISLLLRRHSASCSGGKRADPSADPSRTIGAAYRCEPGECSVQSCLNAFIAAELLSGSNQVTCSECTRRSLLGQPPPPPPSPASAAAAAPPKSSPPSVKRDATKQFLISSLPAVLILHLKRFQIGYRHRVQKIHQEVAFPLLLDMGPFCAAAPQLAGGGQFRTVDARQRSIWYALYGVVVHQGQMGGGHYIAYVKMRAALRADDRRWRFVATRLQEEAAAAEEAERRRRGARRSGEQQELAETIDENGNGLPEESEAAAAAAYDSDDSLSGAQLAQKRAAERQREAAADRLAAEEQQVVAPEGRWYCVSDTRVSEVSEEAVLKAQAYLLFYERIF